MKRVLVFVLLVVAGSAWAQVGITTKARKWAIDHGIRDAAKLAMFSVVVTPAGPEISAWDVPGVPRPTRYDLATLPNPELGLVAPNDLVFTDGVAVRELTAAEKTARRQAGKPLAQKKLENRYIRICEDVLAIADDARATNGVPDALSLAELYVLMDAADGKNQDKKMAKAVRQLTITVQLLNALDPQWFTYVRAEPAAGE